MSGASDRWLHRRTASVHRLGPDPARQGAGFGPIGHLNMGPHGSGQFRTDESLRNRFVGAFGVKPDDPIYLPPEQRVSLWQTERAAACPDTDRQPAADRHEFSGDINSLEALKKPSKVPFLLA